MLKLKKEYDITPTWADVELAMLDARCRDCILRETAKRTKMQSYQEYRHNKGMPAHNLKANQNYARSAEIGVGRKIIDPKFKTTVFSTILHHSWKGRKIHVIEYSTGVI